ncbi:hypothetical protein SFUMM280S_03321 [Streptomyces fumanus]
MVGAALTGVEAATEIAEARPDLDVALAARAGLGDWLSPKGRRHLRKVCDRLGITVHEHTRVTAVEADRVTTADGTVLPAAATVWTAGFAVHPLARSTSLKLGDTGQIVVDETMRSVSHPKVYAVGDAALVINPLRQATAFLQLDDSTTCPTGTDALAPIRPAGEGIAGGRHPLLQPAFPSSHRDFRVQYVSRATTAPMRPLPPIADHLQGA